MNILQKSFITAGLGIAGFSWPYIQTAASFSSNKIHSLLPTFISTSKPYLLGTPHLTGISFLGVFLTSSLFFTKCEDHSVSMNMFERGIQGMGWYTAGVIGGALANTIISSPYSIVNPIIPIIGFTLSAALLGGKLSKLAKEPLHALCEIIDRGASIVILAAEGRLEREDSSAPNSSIQK